MKYIRFEDNSMVLFPSHWDHSQMAKNLRGKPISAGFVKQDECCNDGKPYCTGRSISLKLHCLPDDDKFLQIHLKY